MSGNGEINSHVRSYLTLRKAVGYLGIGLPWILAIGNALLGSSKGIQDSISDYHGTVMRGVLVGVLFAVGVFLYSYVGYPQDENKKRCEVLSDNAAGNWACVFALGVALFPVTSSNALVARLHLVSAAALFLVLAYFSGCLFTKSNKKPGELSAGKVKRNRLYRVCAWVMVGCIVLIGINNFFLEGTSIAAAKPVFWLESIALWAFGASWFAKGRAIRDGRVWLRQVLARG